MKVSFKIATGLALTVGALAFGSAAQAGEGAAAGSVSIRFLAIPTESLPVVPTVPAPTPGVDRISSSVAVGKSYAGATAFTQTGTTGTTNTSAIGAGGSLILTEANGSAAKYDATAEQVLADQETAQANSLSDGSGDAYLRPATGVTLP